MVDDLNRREDRCPTTTMDKVERGRLRERMSHALLAAIRASVRSTGTDPRRSAFLLVHSSSPELFADLLARGAGRVDSLAAHVVERGNAVASIPSDEIACVISVAGQTEMFGFPLSILFDGPSSETQ